MGLMTFLSALTAFMSGFATGFGIAVAVGLLMR